MYSTQFFRCVCVCLWDTDRHTKWTKEIKRVRIVKSDKEWTGTFSHVLLFRFRWNFEAKMNNTNVDGDVYLDSPICDWNFSKALSKWILLTIKGFVAFIKGYRLPILAKRRQNDSERFWKTQQEPKCFRRYWMPILTYILRVLVVGNPSDFIELLLSKQV